MGTKFMTRLLKKNFFKKILDLKGAMEKRMS